MTGMARLLQAILDLGDARAAAGARAALPADVLDRVRTIGDGGVEVAVTNGVAEADDHDSART